VLCACGLLQCFACVFSLTGTETAALSSADAFGIFGNYHSDDHVSAPVLAVHGKLRCAASAAAHCCQQRCTTCMSRAVLVTVWHGAP
jgi:hypothetical protein